MSSALQNRLVGTIIVVALAVIFLPDILGGKKQTNQDLFVELPTPPQMRPVSESETFPQEQVKQQVERKAEIIPDVATDDFDMDEQPTAVEPVENVSTAQDKVEGAALNEVQDRPVEDRPLDNTAVEPPVTTSVAQSLGADSLLEEAGWVVQLGVFRHQKNVRELLNKLKDSGYRAFSRPVKTSTGELTKVFVGPDLDKAVLENALPHLRELTKLQGRVTPFTVK